MVLIGEQGKNTGSFKSILSLREAVYHNSESVLVQVLSNVNAQGAHRAKPLALEPGYIDLEYFLLI